MFMSTTLRLVVIFVEHKCSLQHYHHCLGPVKARMDKKLHFFLTFYSKQKLFSDLRILNAQRNVLNGT